MKSRLLNMMNVKKPKKAMVVLSIAVTMAVVSVGGVVASAASAALPPERSQAEIDARIRRSETQRALDILQNEYSVAINPEPTPEEIDRLLQERQANIDSGKLIVRELSQAEIDRRTAQEEQNRIILEQRRANTESVDVIATERTQEEIDARNRRIQEEVAAGRAIDYGSMSQEEIDELRRNTPLRPPMTLEQTLERAKLYLEKGLTMPEHYWEALVVAGLVSPDDNSNALVRAQQEIHRILRESRP